MNFKEKLPQNAGNRISEVLDFTISPDPPTSARFSAIVNKTTGSAPGSEETDSEQIRLQKDSESKKRKRSAESDTNRQMRLEKERLNKKQKRARKVSQPQHEINQQDHLNVFDNTNNGGIEEQCWAKANINKFNKSVQYIVSQCTECQEAWPLKSKPRTPYIYSRSSRDKKSPKKSSSEN